jgi:hypothetical protein
MSAIPYPGPLRDEPLAIELHNTLFMARRTARDGLAEAPHAWLDGLAARLPGGPGPWPPPRELVALREAVRAALRAAVDGTAPDAAALEALNRACARAPRSPRVRWPAGGEPAAASDYHGASHADIVIAAFAADAIDVLTGPRRRGLRACTAPGCTLMFFKDHPRREWCSPTCGNRARQARHYARTRRRAHA